jgi:hypothetical protein
MHYRYGSRAGGPYGFQFALLHPCSENATMVILLDGVS